MMVGSPQILNYAVKEGQLLRECLVIYVDAALDRNGRAGCGLAVFIRGRAVYTESFGFSHLGGSAQLEAHVCAGALDLAAARWPYHRGIVRTDCAPAVRSRIPSSDSFRGAMVEELIKEKRKLKRQVEKLTTGGAKAASGAVERSLRTIQRRVQKALGTPKRRKRRTAAAAPTARKRATPTTRKRRK